MTADRITVRVPDQNTNRAKIQLNGEDVRCRALDLKLRPGELPDLRIELLPDDIDMEIEAEPTLAMEPIEVPAELVQPVRLHHADIAGEVPEIRGSIDCHFDDPEISKHMRDDPQPTIASICAEALASTLFDRLERCHGRSIVHNLGILKWQAEQEMGVDPYNNGPSW